MNARAKINVLIPPFGLAVGREQDYAIEEILCGGSVGYEGEGVLAPLQSLGLGYSKLVVQISFEAVANPRLLAKNLKLWQRYDVFGSPRFPGNHRRLEAEFLQAVSVCALPGGI